MSKLYETESELRKQHVKGLLLNSELIHEIENIYYRKLKSGAMTEDAFEKKYKELEKELKQLNKKYPRFR